MTHTMIFLDAFCSVLFRSGTEIAPMGARRNSHVIKFYLDDKCRTLPTYFTLHTLGSVL